MYHATAVIMATRPDRYGRSPVAIRVVDHATGAEAGLRYAPHQCAFYDLPEIAFHWGRPGERDTGILFVNMTNGQYRQATASYTQPTEYTPSSAARLLRHQLYGDKP